MKVNLVMDSMAYEGTWVLSAWSSREKAEAEIKRLSKLKKKDKYCKWELLPGRLYSGDQEIYISEYEIDVQEDPK